MLMLTQLPAQRDLPIRPLTTGRFVVAHATAERVLILDSTTGQIYVAEEKDFKKLAELPKLAPRLFERDGEGDRPFRKKEGDREERKEGGKRKKEKEDE